MADEVELERLVVRLVGDGSEFQKMLGEAQQSSKDTAKSVEEAGKQIEGVAASVKQFALAAASGLAALGAADFLKEALANFQEAETISVKLSAALSANGRDVEALMKDYADFAEELQRTTTAEDDAILKLIQTAEVMGVTGESAKRAAKNAIALAAARDTDAQSAIRLTTALEQGHSEMLGKSLPDLRGITDDTQRAAKAQEMLSAMFDVATAAAATSAGEMERLSRDYGNMLEDLGAVVAQGVDPLVKGLKETVAWLKALPPEIKFVTVLILGLATAAAAVVAALATLKGMMLILFGVEAVKAIGVMGLLNAQMRAFGNFLVTNRLVSWTLGIGLAVYAARQLAEAVYESRRSVQEFNKELEKSAELNRQVVEKIGKDTERALSEAAKIEAPQKRREFLTPEVDRAKRELKGYEQAVKSAKKEYEDFHTALAEIRNQPTIALLKQNLKEAEERLKAAKERATRLNEEFGKTDPARQVKEVATEVKHLEESLRLQAQTLGMTAGQVEVYKLRLKGATEAQLELIRAQERANAAQVEVKRRTENIDASVKGLLRSLQMQIATIGMTTAAEKERFEIEDRIASLGGLDPEKERAWLVQLMAVERLAKALTEAEAKQKRFAEGKQLIEQMRDPTERLKNRVTELNLMLREGAIDWGTYEKALKEVTDQTNEQIIAQRGLRAALLETRAAALKGSAEAISRMEMYQDLLKQQTEIGKIQRMVPKVEGIPKPPPMPDFNLPGFPKPIGEGDIRFPGIGKDLNTTFRPGQKPGEPPPFGEPKPMGGMQSRLDQEDRTGRDETIIKLLTEIRDEIKNQRPGIGINLGLAGLGGRG